MIGFVIGDSEMITGFRLVGVKGVEVTSADEAQQALNKVLTRNDVGIIIISEEFLTNSSLSAEVDRVRQEKVTPLIVGIPGSRRSVNEMHLSAKISKILGIKI
jgi:V/A-type H+/Na+-transporting ATPase subunit F